MNIRTALVSAGLVVATLPAFAAAPAVPATSETPVLPPVPLQIVVYDQNDFKGRSLTIDRPVADLNALHFDNKVASLQIKGSGDWVLCENKNYAGRCARVQMQAVNLKLFQLNDRVSSLYPAPMPVPVVPVMKPPATPSKPN